MPEVLAVGLSLFFAWLFARAALHKLAQRAYYLNLMTAYFSASWVAAPLLLLATATELLLACLLLLPGLRGVGLVGTALLLTVYALAMAWQLWRGRADTPCGCSGAGSSLTVAPILVIRNLLCVALAVLALNIGAVLQGWYSLLLSAGCATVLSLLYLWIEQAIANNQYMNEEI